VFDIAEKVVQDLQKYFAALSFCISNSSIAQMLLGLQFSHGRLRL